MVNEAVQKGDEFETHIARSLKKSGFSIVDWSTDVSRKHRDVFVESSTKPDFKVRSPTGQEFYLEAKYRSPNGNKVRWAKPEQFERYKYVSLKENIPVLVALGYGGTPQKPDQNFIFDVNEIKYSDAYLTHLAKYQSKSIRDVEKFLPQPTRKIPTYKPKQKNNIDTSTILYIILSLLIIYIMFG